MVQTEDQYVFIHEALLEAVMAGYTEIPCRSLHHHIQQLMQTEPGKGILTVFKVRREFFPGLDIISIDSKVLITCRFNDKIFGYHFLVPAQPS